MGKLKNLIIDLESSDTDFVMEHYGLFLEKAMKDKQMPNRWSDAVNACLLYTSPSPRDGLLSRMPSSA